MNRLLIIDGHAYAYRAFHAIRELRSPAGRPTNAIYGFIKMLDKIRASLEPTHLIVVWDGGFDADRLAALPEYKAHRPSMPDDLRVQLDQIVSYLSAAGIPSYCGNGIEADDYIATLARKAAALGWAVMIASSDKDFMQLVSDKIGLLNPNDKSGSVWGHKQVIEKSGVSPEQIVDWLALMGDAVDNIPGVPGVGIKTAAQLVNEFGSALALFDRLNEVKSKKLRLALEAAKEDIRRNLALVRLRDVPCEFSPEQLRPKLLNHARLCELFLDWGFKGMLAGVENNASQQAQLF